MSVPQFTQFTSPVDSCLRQKQADGDIACTKIARFGGANASLSFSHGIIQGSIEKKKGPFSIGCMANSNLAASAIASIQGEHAMSQLVIEAQSVRKDPNFNQRMFDVPGDLVRIRGSARLQGELRLPNTTFTVLASTSNKVVSGSVAHRFGPVYIGSELVHIGENDSFLTGAGMALDLGKFYAAAQVNSTGSLTVGATTSLGSTQVAASIEAKLQDQKWAKLAKVGLAKSFPKGTVNASVDSDLKAACTTQLVLARDALAEVTINGDLRTDQLSVSLGLLF